MNIKLLFLPWNIRDKIKKKREEKITIELATSFKSICSLVEAEIFDCDDILSRIKDLHSKHPTLHTPELIPLVKQLSVIIDLEKKDLERLKQNHRNSNLMDCLSD